MAKKEKDITNKKKSHYFKDMKAELKKVVWPSPKQLASNTLAVIVFTLILAVIVFVLDVCFDAIKDHGVTPLQEKITSSYSANTESNESSEENAEGEEATENKASENEENNEENSTEVTVEAESQE